ncbi:hypothetical protein MBLNU230_g0758t1 [Neophaeotheca triangularis]
MTGRPSFLDQPAPANYVAGIGRGATGFTTRSDLGPARAGASDEQMKEHLAQRAKDIGMAPPTAYGIGKKKQDDEEEDEERFKNAEDEGGLLALGSFDQEDDEADRIYQSVDERMEKRRKIIRERREKQDAEAHEKENPKISAQFAPLRQGLAEVSAEDWANLPEAGDYTGKNRRNKRDARGERFYAVPDSVLAGARDFGATGNQVQDDGAATTLEGDGNAGGGVKDNIGAAGEGRKRGLGVRLDSLAKDGTATSGTSTSVDEKGYLTSLDQNIMDAGFDVGDIKRSRVLLESVIKANPKHGPGWIAAARLEHHAGKLVAARNVIKRGCEVCPKNEDVWLMNIYLNKEHLQNAKIVAAKALELNDQSVKLWMEAVNLENFAAGKKRVLRRALDFIPQSVEVWKEAVNLEETPEDARLMLAKAVEMVPLCVEFWLALARLESATPARAQAVINKARKTIPTSHEIWVAAAKLQETTGNTGGLAKLMGNAVKQLLKEGSLVKRDQWIEQAELCEAEEAYQTCSAIIHATIGWGLGDDDSRLNTWLEDGRRASVNGHYHTARTIYQHNTQVFKGSTVAWLALADLESAHGTREDRIRTLKEATDSVPNSRDLWMARAKDHLRNLEYDEARAVLREAFQKNSGDEELTASLVELEMNADNSDGARQILSGARAQNPTDRIYIKSAAFERQIGEADRAFELISEGLSLHPKQAKFYMMRGQLYETKGMIPQAREAYSTGTRVCPQSIPLWLLLSRLEEKTGLAVKARSVLDRARLANKKNPELWAESVRLELRAKQEAAAKQKMAQALQECPTSGLLWAERIWNLEPRTQRKPRAIEAVRGNDQDPILFVIIARLFAGERKLDKADTWFNKATTLDPDYGDGWVYWWKFLQQYGTSEKRASVLEACKEAEPRHGEVWASVRKAPENARKGLEECLRLAVKMVD